MWPSWSYNDHGGDFFFDKYPTFAVGAADIYPVGDEGWGRRPCRISPVMRTSHGISAMSCFTTKFDITVCQEMAVEHGFMVPDATCAGIMTQTGLSKLCPSR